MLAVLARVVTSDNHVDEKERKALHRLAQHNGMTHGEVERALQTALDGTIDLPVPESPEEANRCLKQIIHVCLADGRFSA